ncbi:unnamed protein product [Camellia sinensis]
MGKTSADHGHEGCETEQPLHVEEAVNDVQPAVFAWQQNKFLQQELPFVQVAQFTGIQAVLDSVASAKRIHFIDFGIRSGMNATVLIQALAVRHRVGLALRQKFALGPDELRAGLVRHECPVELLKVTDVATTSELAVEETGKRLLSFADTINLPFFFKAVLVSDIKDLNEDVFEVEAGEAIVVYSPWFLRTMTSRPHRLEALIRVIRNLSPCVMVVTEIDANTDAPTFMDRFVEALFFYGSQFDCLEACINRCNPMRITNEAMYMKYGIHNTVTTEGEERTTRHMKVDAWSEFFGRFQMAEKELSSACFYQARLIVNKFACGSGCTFDMNGNCLLIGWKGTPISSLSAWKFLQEKFLQEE